MIDMPTRYFCSSRICLERGTCDLASKAIGSDVVHVIYFCPQEEHSGSCPHYITSWDGDDQ